MKTTTTPKFFAAATFSSILLLVLFGLSALGANAQQTSRITIKKDFCASIGASNTCNGIPNIYPSHVIFTVELGTYNVATGVFTPTSTSADVDVAISDTNANGSTTTGDIFSGGTYVRVCEIVPNGFVSIPRPENSGGGSSQFSQGSCLIAELGPGNNSLKFINGPSGGVTAADVSISGRVLTSSGRAISRARITVTDAATGETAAVITSSFGYYILPDLKAGGFYIVSINSKRYVFPESSRAISLVDNLADVDFIANP